MVRPDGFPVAQHDRGLQVRQLAVPLIGYPELQGADSSVGGDQGLATEKNLGPGARKPGKQKTRGQSQPQQSDQNLGNDQQVCSGPSRSDSSIADRGHGLHAEVESLKKALSV